MDEINANLTAAPANRLRRNFVNLPTNYLMRVLESSIPSSSTSNVAASNIPNILHSNPPNIAPSNPPNIPMETGMLSLMTSYNDIMNMYIDGNRYNVNMDIVHENVRDYQSNIRLYLLIVQERDRMQNRMSRFSSNNNNNNNPRRQFDIRATYTNLNSLDRLFQNEMTGIFDNLQDILINPTQEQIRNSVIEVEYNSENQNLNVTCPITLDEFEDGDIVCRIIPCGHIFTPQPLMNWFSTHVRCPICRYDIRDYVRGSPNINHNNNNNDNSRVVDNIDNGDGSDVDDSDGSDSHSENMDNVPPTSSTHQSHQPNRRNNRDSNNIMNSIVNTITNNLESYLQNYFETDDERRPFNRSNVFQIDIPIVYYDQSGNAH